jgi:hypothetical protein
MLFCYDNNSFAPTFSRLASPQVLIEGNRSADGILDLIKWNGYVIINKQGSDPPSVQSMVHSEVIGSNFLNNLKIVLGSNYQIGSALLYGKALFNSKSFAIKERTLHG